MMSRRGIASNTSLASPTRPRRPRSRMRALHPLTSSSPWACLTANRAAADAAAAERQRRRSRRQAIRAPPTVGERERERECGGDCLWGGTRASEPEKPLELSPAPPSPLLRIAGDGGGKSVNFLFFFSLLVLEKSY